MLAKDEPFHVDPTKFKSIPKHEIQRFDDGWSTWRGYWAHDASAEKANTKLFALWMEKQCRDQEVKDLGRRRQVQRLQAVNLDDKHRSATLVDLKHPGYSEVFVGRFFENGSKVTFGEEGTWISVSVDAPSHAKSMRGADVLKARDKQLYVSLRAAHNKKKAKAQRAQRLSKMQSQIPSKPGDMSVKGSREDGRLIYAWNTAAVLQGNGGEIFEVDVTPRRHRPALEQEASAWSHKRSRETTPDRALRKMREKIKRSVNKAARGENERIVAVCPRGTSGSDRVGTITSSYQATASSSSARADIVSHCLSLSQVGNPEVFSHLRGAYEFLGTCKFYYCENCDEQWPVFDENKWPDAGVACAGNKVGVCETIARSGWSASSSDPRKCSRCASTANYGKMYSKENLQHLGERHAPLSDLTWYESLLIARVHPVVSVITMTASGMLCFAGHVINYFVKVSEWISELPALLRDKRWFLVKRRKSIRGTGPTHIAHKKPTTANRQRLMAAIAAVKRTMPQVYAGSVVNDAELEKFPADGER